MADKETREETEERHREETLEFDRIHSELEDYGEIMQSCIEEAERTIQIWQGTETMTRQDTEIFLAMMPAISVALFEKVTRKAGLRDDMKLFSQMLDAMKFAEKHPDMIEFNLQTAMQMVIKVFAKNIDKFLEKYGVQNGG